ncbi:hypothetical protein GCM10010344_00310 [Streptomyces bluensis]|nr:hypothetical protein GCM10010344_00310 [Streptomyces bluensis]
MGVSEGESRGDPVAGGEEILHPNATVGQPRSQHCFLGVVPPLAVKARAVDEDILGDEFFKLSDLLRFEDPKVAADDLGIALADGFG